MAMTEEGWALAFCGSMAGGSLEEGALHVWNEKQAQVLVLG